MDVHNYRVYALLAFHSYSYICIGVDWLNGPGLKQGNVYDNPLPKNEWMTDWLTEWIYFFKSKRLERSPTDSFNLGINTHQ